MADNRKYATVISPEAFCYIVDLNDNSRLHFQLMPEVISESKTAMYNEVPIVGRSLPQLGYAGSSARVLGLDLSFVALEREGKYTADWVKSQVRWLEAKAYPRYVNGFTFPPSKVLLMVGNVVGLQAVVTSCTTSWTGPWDTRDIDAKPFRASVSIQLQEVGQNDGAWGHPFGASEAISSQNQAVWGHIGEAYIEIPLSDNNTYLTPGQPFTPVPSPPNTEG